MNVLLINPNTYRPYVPPIGLEYVCNSLDQSGMPFEVADLNFTTPSALLRRLPNAGYGLIGITIRNTDSASLTDGHTFIPGIRRLIRKIRARTAAKIVLGGAGYSHLPAEYLRHLGADFGVVGFGETALPLLIRALESGGDLARIPNLVWRDGQEVRINPLSNEGYAALPPRKRRFVRNPDYYSVYRMANIETRRGCDRQCGYCNEPLTTGRTVTAREIGHVLAELQDLRQQGIVNFSFCDSEFNVGERTYIEELCARMIDAKLGMTWTTSFYPEGDFPLPLFQRMHAAGCREIALSVDSGSDRILGAMGKTHTRRDVLLNSEAIRRAGIALLHYYLIGWPGESPATLDETVDLIRQSRPDMSLFFAGIRVEPNTRLSQIARQEGLFQTHDDLMHPVFYNADGVRRHLLPYLRKQTRGLPGCVLPSRMRNFSHALIHQAYFHGYEGPTATISAYFRTQPPGQLLTILLGALADWLVPGRSLLKRKRKSEIG